MLDPGVNVLHPGDGLMREVACVVTNAAGELLVSSEDGGEVGVFDASGRHLRTVDAWTGVTNLTFAYTDYGGRLLLTAIRDVDGLETLIERDGAGKPQAVVGPYGQRTVLYLNGDGYLWKVVNPAGETNQYGYGTGGLLTSATDRRGYTSTLSHDGEGRVTNAVDAVGGGYTLWRGEPYHPGVVGWAPDRVGYYVDVTWPEGQTSSHGMYTLSSGVRYRDIEWPDGTRVESWGTPYSETQSFVTAEAAWTVRRTPDTRFGMTAPVETEQRVKLPSGLTWTGGEERLVGLAGGGDPLNVLWVTNTVTENGRKSVASYAAANRVVKVTSAAGRQSQATLDAQGRVVEVEIPGLYPLAVSYDTDGRPLTMTQGSGAASRVVQIGYDNNGYLRAVTNGLGERVELLSDAIGRVTNVVLADEGRIGLRYDHSEEVVGVTPPERDEHALDYNGVHLLTNYVPPVLGSETNALHWTYNLNRQLTGVVRADGTTITNGYDSKGRLNVAAWPGDRVTVSYDAASRVSSVTASNGASLNYSYDGFLLTNVVVSCAGVSGTLAYAYSTDLWLTHLAVNGISVGYGRDADGLLVRAGDLALNRRADNGFLTDTVLGNVRDEMSYNGFGEVTNYTAAYGGTNLLSLRYEHDLLGRITSRVETIQGETDRYGYSYDVRGQLAQVTTNGAAYSQYAYDANGNRASSVVAASISTASYDGQDRLLTNGNVTYQWDANGTLTHRIAGGQATAFRYNAMGRLLSVSSSVAVVEYELDALGRRVGKKVNGVVQRRWLYQSFLRPALELDAAGQVVARFVYATGVNVPDYMVRTGRTYRIIKDHLGSVRLVVDVQNGSIAQRLDYDEWGRVTRDTNPGFQPFGFAGGLYDADTGLVRFGYRDYDAQTGRWTAKDPILFGGGQANLYVYCGNDSVDLLDYSGLQLFPRGVPVEVSPIGGGLRVMARGPVRTSWADTGLSGQAGTPGSRWDALGALGLNTIEKDNAYNILVIIGFFPVRALPVKPAAEPSGRQYPPGDPGDPPGFYNPDIPPGGIPLPRFLPARSPQPKPLVGKKPLCPR
jgi:RHS repeat-associated protein